MYSSPGAYFAKCLVQVVGANCQKRRQMSQVNSSFSLETPSLQLALDSTSISLAKECPRKYQLAMIEAWSPRGEKVDLQFGIWLHEARQQYEIIRASGADHDEAVDKVLDRLLKATWNRDLGRPWISENPVKNRKTLIQTVVWYLDAKGKDDPLETLRDADGKPQVERSFRFDSQIRSKKGEMVLFCGHMDRLARLGISNYIADIKTTKSIPDARWFSQFNPHNQFTLYTFAGKVAFQVPVEGVIVDGVQVGVEFARFQRGIAPRDDGQIEEWYRGVQELFLQLEHFAEAQFWPMNETACDKFGGCQFREICSKSPGSRQHWLEANFVKKIWDPLQVRGEI